MPKISKNKLSVIVILIAVMAVLAIKYFKNPTFNSAKLEAEPRQKGPKEAPVQIIEYIDFQCPACAAGVKFLQKFMRENPQKVHLQMKYFPLRMHQHAFLASRYAQCAAQQNLFWPYHDYLIDRQNQWKRLVDATPAFELIADETMLDRKKLESCLADDSLDDVINKDKQSGVKLGVKSTPTYFINGEMFVGIKNLQQKLNEFAGQ